MTVKRKRVLQFDRPAADAPAAPGDVGLAQAPKVYVLRPADAAPSADAAAAAQPPAHAERPRHRRRRRNLNGEVTVIRPERLAAAPTRTLVSRNPAGVLPPHLGYPRLVAQIRALEEQARLLQQREQAISWARPLIKLFKLTEQELGL